MDSPNLTNLDPYLCQPDGKKSCAWCCGLYNVRESRRDSLARKLDKRAKRFVGTDRNATAILQFSEQTIEEEQVEAIDPELYSCEFVGCLDSSGIKVGCMLHPHARGNHGQDWRGLSFFGAMACKGFFCCSFRKLSRAEKVFIIDAIQDWYLYGLVISDADYSKSFFRIIEERLMGRLDFEKLLRPSASKLAYQFFRWKIDWPFKKPYSQLKSSTCSQAPRQTCQANDQENSRESSSLIHLIFRSLDSEFRSDAELLTAEHMVDRLFSRLVNLL